MLRFFRGLIPLILSGIVTAAAAQTEAQFQPQVASPNLEITVSLLKNSVRPGESVPVQLWFANPSELRLSQLDLRVQTPEFLYVAPKECADQTQEIISLGSLEARQAGHLELRLCAKEQIKEGEFQLLFVIHYKWSVSGRVHAAFKAVEKDVGTALLSTHSVGGFSLRLTAFFLPGLIFWMLLRLFRVPYTTDFTTGESAALSVLVSALLILVVSAGGVGGEPEEISFGKLGLLCLMAFVPSLFVGLVVLEVRRRIANRRKAGIIRKTDSETAILEKVLSKAALMKEKNVVVRVDRDSGGSEEFIGSAFAASGEGGIVLIGWFRLGNPTGSREAPRTKLFERWRRRQAGSLDENLKRGHYAAVLSSAARAELTIELRDGIRCRGADGNLVSTGEGHRFFSDKEVLSSGYTREGPEPRLPLSTT